VIPLRLPPDILYAHAGHADSAVVFSHVTHVAFAENRCTGCHPAAFRMLSRGPVPRHGDMNAGGSCGRCHDGRQAFGVRDASACGTCHSGARTEKPAAASAGGIAGGAPQAPPLPKPHTYPASDASPGSVTFRHKTHPSGPNGCVTCHPKPFRMAATPPLPDGGMHEAQACGSCHDGKKAFATDQDAACMRCHRESGGRP
jgi:c(7)-type cytochrome triheme protein